MGRRAVGVYAALVLIFTGMICRVYALSMGGALASAANTQSAFVLDVDNTRGVIYDCNLKPLVGTEVRKLAAVQPSPEAFTALAEAGEQVPAGASQTKPYLLPVEEEVYAKGVEMIDAVERYGDEQLAPHIVGYLNPEKTNGAAGIEMAYDDLLKQYDGSLKLRYTLDAAGHTLTLNPPEVLRDNYKSEGGVALTLDADFQRIAQRAMKGVEKGAAVVMDVATGDIKASVSVPAYDANDLAASLQDPDSPFVNRAFSQYNVGSTFKLVVAAAALESGVSRYERYTCEGYADVGGHIFYCHWRNGHGNIDLKKAIEISCNPFFIHLGLETGGKNIVSMAREIGFTRAAQFTDDIRTQSGTLPSDAELESDAAVANLSFGQGSLTATPIQIAQMVSTTANGGFAVTPRLVEGFTDDGKTYYEHTAAYAPSRVFSKRTSDILRETLVNNVEVGSGVKANPTVAGVGAGGKTASAQTGIYLEPGVEESEVVHAWFAGYFPADTPKYAVVVLVEDGKSGEDTAAPIFRKIADGILVTELQRQGK
ncbi:penicillin-binding protein 2 [Anaerotruncus massiliensis (ex Togo et al. 2019)]|uniref:peptidoglycan D,D-transpeptidase FtsI family protein n=1 Tax=Anaerotruncus TaxID=244127 RepID=UPI000C755B79|nr:penicillin-binding transpeptidase domain-containing protein [Anaerotruncus massiliensis (ex Togo et al. 2019)]